MKYIILVSLNLVVISVVAIPVPISDSATDESNDGQSVFLPLCINNSPPPIGEMVFVPAGEFQMGCDPVHSVVACSFNYVDIPQHTVFLDDYFIDKYEVTITQYTECAVAGACSYPPLMNLSITHPRYFDNPTYHPMINVSWYDARDYCTWDGKRLPTEAEWEKAARGTTLRTFPWGDQAPDCTLANYYPCVLYTTQVGSYPLGASPYGALDMTGNVYEWVNDWADNGYYSISPYENPPGPITGTWKVMRGGSWRTISPEQLAVSARNGTVPFDRNWGIGFRCASPP